MKCIIVVVASALGALVHLMPLKLYIFPLYIELQTLLLMGVKTSWRPPGLADIQTIWHEVTAAVGLLPEKCVHGGATQLRPSAGHL